MLVPARAVVGVLRFELGGHLEQRHFGRITRRLIATRPARELGIVARRHHVDEVLIFLHMIVFDAEHGQFTLTDSTGILSVPTSVKTAPGAR